MNNVSSWMSWEGGVDVAAATNAAAQMPNLIIHLGRTVNTPAGSAPSGMVLWQPEGAAAPVVMGFVSTNAEVGGYFGPYIFKDTPFEQAPVLNAQIEIEITDTSARSTCVVGGYTFEVEMTGLSEAYLINRDPAPMSPFRQQGVERACGHTVVKINGEVIPLFYPPQGITGGPSSVVSPNGVYAR